MAQLQVPYAGVPNFARSMGASLNTLRAGNVAIVGVPLESVGLRPGMQDGPRAIREASVDFIYPLQTSGTLVDIDSGRTLTWPKSSKLVDLGDLPAAPGESERTQNTLREFFASLVKKRVVPIALGGDRFITYPLFAGFGEALRQRRRKAGFIQLSGDLAMQDEHPVWGKHWHGATARRVLESGYVEPRNAVLVGVRGLQPYEEWEWAKRLGVTVLTLAEVRQQGLAAIAQQALEIAGREDRAVYLSVDISVVDAGSAPGRGAVVVGGCTAQELLELAHHLASPQVEAVDMVGVAPVWDLGGRAPRLAAEALIELIAPRVFR